MNAASETKNFADFKVADLALADWGRKEIAIARDRDARPDGDPRRVRARAAAARRAHRGLAAHDDPDRGADRDAAGARRRGALGVVQHLLDAGPCRRGHRRQRHAGVRVQGRVAGRVLGLHAPHLRVGPNGERPEHDPRRRRRRDAARAPRHAGRVRRLVHLRIRPTRRKRRCSRRSRRSSPRTPSSIRASRPASRA